METLLRPITNADDPEETGFVFGESPAIRGLNAMIAEVAQTDIPVLIVGESGTGKEIYARAIHRLSGALNLQPRLINCGLLEGRRIVSALREVFREGEDSARPESLILDGIDELDLATQKVLLSVLAEREWNRNAGQRNLRLISTATKNMENEIESGGFRRELYFRLNGACVRLPALRERKEDIVALAEYFLLKHSRLLGKKTPHLESGALEILREYPWPGNIRELENLTRKIVAVGDSEEALLDLRTARLQQVKTQEKAATSSLKIAAKVASRGRERELILGALHRTKWNRKQAARELQISYKSLLHKIKQIEAPEVLLQERGGK
jgi:DNA-binding NtrC family response regulator